MNRFDGIVINAIGEAVSGAFVFVCSQPANTASIPPSPLIQLYSDAAGSQILANPVEVDGNGNYFFYAPTGTYTLVYFDPFSRITTQVFPDQAVVTQGGGSVSSVGLSVPDGFAVTGSPVSSSGTLGLGYSADWLANTFLAGPIVAPAGLPSRRKLNAADLTGLGLGSVTSVDASVTPGALFTALFVGGPVTSTGVLALSFDFSPQLSGKFLAGPTSGGLGAVTARSIVPTDLPQLSALSFDPAPIFNGGTSSSFSMTLTANVPSSTFIGGASGQIYTFVIKQDVTGGRSFAWPANVIGAGIVDTTTNSVNIQSFIFDGTNLIAISNMLTLI